METCSQIHTQFCKLAIMYVLPFRNKILFKQNTDKQNKHSKQKNRDLAEIEKKETMM